MDIDLFEDTFTFDPSGLELGVYAVELAVTDDGEGNLTNRKTIYIRVADELFPLGDGDTDGDGISDITEGYGDEDLDGIANYQDPITDRNVMPEHFDVTNGYLVEADPGVRLRLGAFAIEGLTGGVRILDEQITSSDSVLYEDNYDNVCGYFDFDVF